MMAVGLSRFRRNVCFVQSFLGDSTAQPRVNRDKAQAEHRVSVMLHVADIGGEHRHGGAGRHTSTARPR